MRSPAFALALSALPALALAETCDRVSEEIEYCSALRSSDGPITRAAFPDLVKLYYVQNEPLVASSVILAAAPEPDMTGEALVRLALRQIMVEGVARWADVTDVSYGTRQIAGRLAAQAEMLGRHADGGVMAALVVEVIQFDADALIVITTDERADTVTPALRALHTQSLRNLRFDGL